MKAKIEKIKGKYYAVLPTNEVMEVKSKSSYKDGDVVNGKVVTVNRQYWSDMLTYHKKIRVFKPE